jgi:hypothetical protein
MTKTLTEEIGDMLGDLDPGDSEEATETETKTEIEDTEAEDAESTDTEEVEEDADGEEEEPVEEVQESEDVEERPSEDEEEAGEEEEREDEEEEAAEEEPDELSSLRSRLEQASGLLLQHGITLPAEEGGEIPAVETPAVETPIVPDAATLEDLAILEEDVDFDDVMNDREAFIKTMRGILGRYRGLLAQDFTRAIPGMVANQVRQVSTLTKAVDEFYREHSDLLPVRKTVGAIANQITAEKPEWSMAQIMTESAKRTRKVLKMKTPKKSGKIVKPSFAKSKGKGAQRKPKPKVSKLQSEIDDVLD